MKDQIKLLAKVADKKTGNIRIKPNCMRATNWTITIHINHESDLDVTAKADKVIGAANAIKGEINIKQTDKSIVMSGGNIRVTCPTVDNSEFPDSEPAKDHKTVNGGIIPQLKLAALFAADNDVRPFLNGVYMADGYIRASDGHAGVRLDGVEGISAILPKQTVALLADIGDEPESVGSEGMSITFFYSWGWVKSQVINAKFPDMDRLFLDVDSYTDTKPIGDAVAIIRKISGPGAKIIIDGGKITDELSDIEIETDGSYPRCSFGAELLDRGLSVAKEIALPNNKVDEKKPAMIRGDFGLIGVVMPVRI